MEHARYQKIYLETELQEVNTRKLAFNIAVGIYGSNLYSEILEQCEGDVGKATKGILLEKYQFSELEANYLAPVLASFEKDARQVLREERLRSDTNRNKKMGRKSKSR
jgi:hypothetical protein